MAGGKNTGMLLILSFLLISCASEKSKIAESDYFNYTSSVIKTKGAKTVLAELYNSPKEWGRLLENIKVGSGKGFAIAEELHKFSDSGSSEELSLAVGEGLFNSPEAGLEFLSKTKEFSVNSVCGNVDDKFATTAEEEEKEIFRRKKILEGIKRSHNDTIKQQCLMALNELESSIPWAFGAVQQGQ